MIEKTLEEIVIRAKGNYAPGVKSLSHYRKCKWCGEQYPVNHGEIEYIIILKNKKYYFCSWTHKCKFRDEHKVEIERELIRKLNPYRVRYNKNER